MTDGWTKTMKQSYEFMVIHWGFIEISVWKIGIFFWIYDHWPVKMWCQKGLSGWTWLVSTTRSPVMFVIRGLHRPLVPIRASSFFVLSIATPFSEIRCDLWFVALPYKKEHFLLTAKKPWGFVVSICDWVQHIRWLSTTSHSWLNHW